MVYCMRTVVDFQTTKREMCNVTTTWESDLSFLLQRGVGLRCGYSVVVVVPDD